MTTRARTFTLVFLLVVLAAAFHDLGGRTLHELDTARWGQLAREMIRSGSWLVPTRYGELYVNKPPLYLWLVAGPSYAAGEVTPILARLPSALGLVVLVLGTTWWARMRTGSAEAGRIAGLLVLSTGALAWLGRDARLDMMGAAVSLIAAAVLDRAALGLGTRRTPWIAGLLVGVALLTKGPPLLLVPAAVLFAGSPGRTLRERLRAARPLLVLAVGFGVALLWFVPAVLSAGWAAYGHKLLVGQAAERITGTIDQTKPAWFYVQALVLPYAPWGGAYLVVALGALVPSVRRRLGSAGSLAVAGTVVLVVFSLIPTKHARYLAPVVPLFAVALAAWIRVWLQRGARARWPVHLRALAILAGLGAAGLLGWGLVQAQLLLPLLVPVVGFAILAWATARRSQGDDPRRRFVYGVLYGIVLILLTVNVVRPRLHVGAKEVFNERLAELRRGGVPVWIAPDMTPENVFHGAPDARFFLDVEAPVPRGEDGRLLVIVRSYDAPKLRAPDGTPGTILHAGPPPDSWAIVGFGYP